MVFLFSSKFDFAQILFSKLLSEEHWKIGHFIFSKGGFTGSSGLSGSTSSSFLYNG